MTDPAVKIAQAARIAARREHERRGTGRRRATVIRTSPLLLDLHGSELQLDDTDVTLSRAVKAAGIAVDDVLALLEVDTNEWVALGSEPADDDPAPTEYATQAALDAADARLDALEAGPEAVRYIGAAGQPGFLNLWVNFDTGLATPTLDDTSRDCGFYRDAGRVYLVGLMKSGTVGQGAFLLPAGYRPPYTVGPLNFAVPSNGAFGLLQVWPSGAVVPATGSNAYMDISGVGFRHA